LNQAHDVLRQEREDINKEWLHLLVWVSLLKQQMTSEKEKVEVRQKNLDVMEVLYSRRQVVVDKLDAQTEKLLDNAKELYAVAEARTNATIKQQEDLNAQAVATAKREQAVAEQELKLWEKEEQGDLSLERELEALTSREATIAVEWKDLEETHAVVLSRELATDIRDSGLNFREEELADREKRLVEREQQLAGRQL
jgi:hypothetical protein